MLGLLLMLLMVGMALGADLLTSFAPFKSAAAPLQSPSLDHPMGTDDLGRDMLTRVLYGARTSLWVGVTITAIAAVVGTLIGIVSGYFGGWLDDGLMRFTECFHVMPRFFLAVIVIAFFGSGIDRVVLVLGLTSWTMIARLLRAEVLSLRQKEFITAARAVGAPDRSILWRHVLPTVASPLVTAASLLIGQAILLEASLSFLGLGDPNAVSWGTMLNNARGFLRTAPWMAFFPGLAITLSVLGLNLMGDALNDAWNPIGRRGVPRRSP
jgi:peptide/nickel transport system permease protein